jgi:hypothetical protein
MACSVLGFLVFELLEELVSMAVVASGEEKISNGHE